MNKEHKTIPLIAPKYLGLRTIDGEPKNSPIHVDIEIADLIQKLWNRGIGTVGCCKGYNDSKTVNCNIAWIQIGSNWQYPNWISKCCIEKQ